MGFKQKLFGLLWLAGMMGEIANLWIDLPLPETELPFSPLTIKLLGLVQSTILLSIAILIGVTLASRVSLAAPFAEALARGDSKPIVALKNQLLPGLTGGLVGGGLALACFALLEPSLPADFLTAAEALEVPLLTRLLRGGVTEEILLRWGVMTLLVWLPWRVLQGKQGDPRPHYVAFAIGISGLLFGLLHLPVAFILSAEVTASLVLYVVGANTLFSLVAGYLYWQTGLEAAMIAHAFFHLLIVTWQSWL